MTPKLIAISLPQVNLTPFTQVLSRTEVNEVDAKNITPAAKFAELVDNLLSDECSPYKHLTATFFYELPLELENELRNFDFFSCFQVSSLAHGFLVRGMLTGSLVHWRLLVAWATRKSASTYLKSFGTGLARAFAGYPYFQGAIECQNVLLDS